MSWWKLAGGHSGGDEGRRDSEHGPAPAAHVRVISRSRRRDLIRTGRAAAASAVESRDDTLSLGARPTRRTPGDPLGPTHLLACFLILTSSGLRNSYWTRADSDSGGWRSAVTQRRRGQHRRALCSGIRCQCQILLPRTCPYAFASLISSAGWLDGWADGTWFGGRARRTHQTHPRPCHQDRRN